jgi:hypothetical protein
MSDFVTHLHLFVYYLTTRIFVQHRLVHLSTSRHRQRMICLLGRHESIPLLLPPLLRLHCAHAENAAPLSQVLHEILHVAQMLSEQILLVLCRPDILFGTSSLCSGLRPIDRFPSPIKSGDHFLAPSSKDCGIGSRRGARNLWHLCLWHKVKVQELDHFQLYLA